MFIAPDIQNTIKTSQVLYEFRKDTLTNEASEINIRLYLDSGKYILQIGCYLIKSLTFTVLICLFFSGILLKQTPSRK